MIVRTWGAIASEAKNDDYLDEVKNKILDIFAQSPGYLGCYFLRKYQNHQWRYLLLTFWDSLEAAQGMGGESDKAHVPEYIQATLEQFDETVELFEVALEHGFQTR